MLYIDTETYNTQPITVGTYQYAATCELLLVTYAIDNGPVKLWDLTRTITRPQDLLEALSDSTQLITAHNAIFDRRVIKHTLNIEPDLQRWRCTMAQAYAHALPGSLDELGKVLNLPQDKLKLKDGKKLIQRFCKPTPSNHKAQRYDRHSHPSEWQRFCEYAIGDVQALRETAKRLPDWNYRRQELDLYHLDQTINDRGFSVDTEFVCAAVNNEDSDKARYLDRFREITGGRVLSPTQREKFKTFIRERYSIDLANTQKGTLIALVNDENTPAQCQELCQLAMALTKSSVAKYRRLLPAISSDRRFRGGLQFNGASRTRRWAGRVFQPHNLPSRGIPHQRDLENYIDALKYSVHDLLFDDLTAYSSAALRGVMIAPKNSKLLISDLANIEGRINAWLANEVWALKAYQDFDNGKGHDLYKLTASGIFGKLPEHITKEERQLGKVACLAYGYQGSVGATQVFCQAIGIKMADYWDHLQETLPGRCIQKAHDNYQSWGHESDTDKTEWIASDAIKVAWREKHPATVKLWYDCQNAAKAALSQPGRVFPAGRYLAFKTLTHAGIPFLLCRLPGGNFLTYCQPRLDSDGSLSYMGIDNTAQRSGYSWRRIRTYGGKLVENACQSLARDILAHNMLAMEKENYLTILTVHDEVIAEVPDTSDYTHEKLSQRLASNPPWATGLPLAASGDESHRYGKF